MNKENKEKIREYTAALCAFLTEFENIDKQMEIYDYVLELMDKQITKVQD